MNTTQITESLKTAFKAKNLEAVITEYEWTVRIEAPVEDVKVNIGSVRCGCNQSPHLVIWDASFNLYSVAQDYEDTLKVWAYIHNINVFNYGE